MARVIVVDDEVAMLALLTVVLSRAGHDVRAASSIAEARAALDEVTDLLVADVRMPDGNGVDLADDAERVLPALRVLFVTGSPPPSDRIRNRPVLLKPFSVAELITAADDALRAGTGGRRSRPRRTSASL